MAKALGGLMNRLARRRPRQDESQVDPPPVDADATVVDSAPLKMPHVLMPAVIFRQKLFDATEFTPAWARPRQAPVPNVAPVPETDQPKPTKRARRSSPIGSPATTRPKAKARRVAKPKDNAPET